MHRTFLRVVSFSLVLALLSTGMPVLAQDANSGTQAASQPSSTTAQGELPDSPGTLIAQSNGGAQASSAAASPQDTQQTQPSGTAVAPSVQTSGGAASKPAGVAIAPPKQRQRRSWLIKFGFIAGAGAALGTVAALSAASPGHVPGSGH
jgi:hypothetical protein